MDHFIFNSITEMARTVRDMERCDGSGTVSEKWRPVDEVPFSYDEAIELGLKGGYWEEGAKLMVDGVADAAALRENVPQPMLENDVAGFMPDVPAYLAGQPDCMVAYQEGDLTVSQTPSISIGIGTFSANVDAPSVFNRGVAILSLVDVLEAIGYRVQVEYAGDTTTGHGNGQKKIRCILKRAQDHWNPGTIAFATANASVLRRYIFKMLESDPDTVKSTLSGYGKGDDGYLEEYSMAFGYMTSNYGYRTLPEALRSVERIANDFGMAVNLTGSKDSE